MQTNVTADKGLIARAMKCTGLKTKKAVVDEALRTLIQMRAQESARKLRGKLHWEGNLDKMRQGRLLDVDR